MMDEATQRYYMRALDELREMRDGGKPFRTMAEYLDNRVYSLIEIGDAQLAMNLAKASKSLIHWY